MLSLKPNFYRSLQSFNAVMDGVDKWANTLSNSDKKRYSDELDHGAGMLKSSAQLNMYLHKYGRIHQAKLLLSFQHLPEEVWSTDGLSIVDYGCGQGVAEMVLSDFIQTIFVDNNYISEISLIEPSLANLRQAEKYISEFYKDVDLRTINKYESQLHLDDLKVQNDFVLHILSNVVDLDDFDGSRIIDI